MPPQTVVARVERLEERVTALEGLPAQIAELRADFLQFQVEVRAEFSALRTEFRTELQTEIGRLRTELHTKIAAVRAELREMRAQMLALHEDLIERIARLGGARRPRKKR